MPTSDELVVQVTGAHGPKGAPDMSRPFDPVLSQQDVPCTAEAATCYFSGGYKCDYANGMWPVSSMHADHWYEMKPGSPAVCAHGNREFSFLASKRADTKKLVLMLQAGGICWDAKTCGDPQARQVSIDSLLDMVPNPGTGTVRELAPTVPRALSSAPVSPSGQSSFEAGLLDRDPSNYFAEWSAVVVPDCTGDLHLGNRSYSYDSGQTTCITAHHKGSVNTGEAIKWVQENFKDLSHILLVGSGLPKSHASGGPSAVIWASYLAEVYPHAVVRTVTDSSLVLNGPRAGDFLHDDPWGSVHARIPKWDTYPPDTTDPEGLLRVAPNGGFLAPPPEEWNLWEDSLTDLYRLMGRVMPKLGFTELTTAQDAVQKDFFVVTGGKPDGVDCCLDGCGCARAQPHGVRGGTLDWDKTLKVALLQRHERARNNYRFFMHHDENSAEHFLLMDSASYTSSSGSVKLKDWLQEFVESTITLVNELDSRTQRTMTKVETTLPGSVVCADCLSGVLGAVGPGQSATAPTLPEHHEKCLMSWGQGENFYKVAPKFDTDWMALWSLNGGDAPDVMQEFTQQGHAKRSTYRFAHEYHVRPGETMESIAERFGTTVENLLKLNQNLITHVHNPKRVQTGDVLCLAPHFHQTKDQMGLPICPSDRQTFGDGGGEGEGDDDISPEQLIDEVVMGGDAIASSAFCQESDTPYACNGETDGMHQGVDPACFEALERSLSDNMPPPSVRQACQSVDDAVNNDLSVDEIANMFPASCKIALFTHLGIPCPR